MVEVFSLGGCMSCGNDLWQFLSKAGVDPIHKNVQITHYREEAMRRAAEITDEQSYFPMIFINDTVVFGFKPDILQVEIDKLKETA